MADRELTISHAIGPTGRFRLSSASGTVRIEGGDGDEVHVLARYRAPGGVDPASDPAQDGVVEVVRDAGELRVAVRDPGGSGMIAGLARLVGQYRPDVDFQVRLPRAASLRLDGVSSDAKLRDVRGEQDLHTVSGDLELRGVGGRIRVTTVSGDVAIRGDVLSLAATTTSGDLAVEAELVQQLAVRSVSGDVSVRATFGRETDHTFESVSGDLRLATPNGLTIEATGMSGTVRSELPTQREQRDGRRATLIGDGSVRLRVRTVSGDVVVLRPGEPAGGRRGADPFGLGATIADAVGAAFPPRPPEAPIPPRPPGSPAPRPVIPLPAPAAPRDVVAAGAASSGAASSGAGQLAILRLLESGEIDVDEAARRLEALS